jgi:hypothetical protein
LAIRSDPRDALTIFGSGFNFGGRQQRLQILGSLERPQRDQDRSGKTRQLARIAVFFLWARDTGSGLEPPNRHSDVTIMEGRMSP